MGSPKRGYYLAWGKFIKMKYVRIEGVYATMSEGRCNELHSDSLILCIKICLNKIHFAWPMAVFADISINTMCKCSLDWT